MLVKIKYKSDAFVRHRLAASIYRSTYCWRYNETKNLYNILKYLIVYWMYNLLSSNFRDSVPSLTAWVLLSIISLAPRFLSFLLLWISSFLWSWVAVSIFQNWRRTSKVIFQNTSHDSEKKHNLKKNKWDVLLPDIATNLDDVSLAIRHFVIYSLMWQLFIAVCREHQILN